MSFTSKIIVLQRQKKSYNENIYNFDKTKFWARVKNNQCVITKDNISIYLYRKVFDNKGYITLVENIKIRKNVLSNILILSGKKHLKKCFK